MKLKLSEVIWWTFQPCWILQNFKCLDWKLTQRYLTLFTDELSNKVIILNISLLQRTTAQEHQHRLIGKNAKTLSLFLFFPENLFDFLIKLGKNYYWTCPRKEPITKLFPLSIELHGVQSPYHFHSISKVDDNFYWDLLLFNPFSIIFSLPNLAFRCSFWYRKSLFYVISF